MCFLPPLRLKKKTLPMKTQSGNSALDCSFQRYLLVFTKSDFCSTRLASAEFKNRDCSFCSCLLYQKNITKGSLSSLTGTCIIQYYIRAMACVCGWNQLWVSTITHWDTHYICIDGEEANIRALDQFLDARTTKSKNTAIVKSTYLDWYTVLM